MTDSGRAFVALAGGLAAGLAVRSLALGASEAAAAVIEPIGLLRSNAIRLGVIPLVMASILLAVLDAKALGGLGRTGGLILVVALGFLAVAAAASLILGPPVLDSAPVSQETLALLRRHY